MKNGELLAWLLIGVAIACVGIFFFTEYKKAHSTESKVTEIQKLEAREMKLASVIANYENRRDQIRSEIKELNVKKFALSLEEGPTNPPPIITTNIIQQVTVIHTNVIAYADEVRDGRLTARMRIEEQFKTREIYVLPFSPHEFIFKSDGHIYYAFCTGTTTNAECYFRIFE